MNEIRPDTARIPKSIFVSNKKINEEVDEGEKEKIIAAQNMKKKNKKLNNCGKKILIFWLRISLMEIKLKNGFFSHLCFKMGQKNLAFQTVKLNVTDSERTKWTLGKGNIETIKRIYLTRNQRWAFGYFTLLLVNFLSGSGVAE